jgi:diguanylate cyclase (GGDEF)-like protein
MAIALFVYIIVSNDRSSKKLLKETELLKNEVETDSLTGAGSRAFGDSLLQGYMNTFIKNDINCTIALLDIDNFKSVNDCYGHNVGDAVLKNLVETIKMLLHENDNIIRWGGDEFIITINDIDDKLESVLEHINKKIAEQVILSENGEKLHYTISIGASHFSIRDKNITDTIKRVDDALYLAKRTKNSYYIIG